LHEDAFTVGSAMPKASHHVAEQIGVYESFVEIELPTDAAHQVIVLFNRKGGVNIRPSLYEPD
jgi:hypothetical protein